MREVVYSDASDVEIVRAVANGDRRAFEEMYARHRQPLWSFIRHYVADSQLAEEILQQDTLVATRRPPPWRLPRGVAQVQSE